MSEKKRKPEEFRSHRWFGVDDMRGFGQRSRIKQLGYSREDFEGKPVIAILNTWSGISTCHSHFPQRVEEIKRGIFQAGGFPIEIPVMGLSENFVKPTTMLYRNLLAMETEEVLRCHPIDAVVLMGGCDKTTPGLLMGAISMNLPTIYFPAGAMLRGNWRGKILGSGSDVWKYWAERRAGNLSDESWVELEDGIARSPGTCMTMGTAATMMSLVEVLGFTLPSGSSIPAVDSNHSRLAAASGRRIVEMAWEDLKPSDILSYESFENAIAVDLAISGSTNAIIHLVALARRAGIELTIDDFDRISQKVPVIGNLRPSGQYLMEDFYYAGGLRALMARMKTLLHTKCINVNGSTIDQNIAGAEVFNDDVIRPIDQPIWSSGGLVVLHGNLAPRGCVIKPAAAESHLLRHTGPAIVFKNYDDMSARIDDPDLPVTADSVLILQNAGPIGGPGMPEWGQLPIPKKLLAQGVRDMVRLSDARMSGTSYGACVLHIAPESAVGGPLALVRDGDLISLDVENRRLDLLVDENILVERAEQWRPKSIIYPRGYGLLAAQHMTQADEGCDFDFLQYNGESTPEPEIH